MTPPQAKASPIRRPLKAEEFATQVKAELKDAWLPLIYSQRIRKMRTRSYSFENLKSTTRVTIQHTLLGVELKTGSRRLLCPDLATARYLAVFARLGCTVVAVPYDITRISHLADELESSWHRTMILADHHTAGASSAIQSRVRRLLIRMMKDEVNDAGAGSAVPEFKQSTKQQSR
ncbi:MAG TPA: hypothetical protein VGW36_04765 [Pyrinomonadaceae bacterium]|nr:hypothetical protein [Pyrinomonadaceae bacterium]